jgi:hypothetical protein
MPVGDNRMMPGAISDKFVLSVPDNLKDKIPAFL